MDVELDRSGRINLFIDFDVCGDNMTFFAHFTSTNVVMTRTDVRTASLPTGSCPGSDGAVEHSIPITDADTIWSHRDDFGNVTSIVINHGSDRRTCTWIGIIGRHRRHRRHRRCVMRFRLPVPFHEIIRDGSFITEDGMWVLGVIDGDSDSLPMGGGEAFFGRIPDSEEKKQCVEIKDVTDVSFDVEFKYI